MLEEENRFKKVASKYQPKYASSTRSGWRVICPNALKSILSAFYEKEKAATYCDGYAKKSMLFVIKETKSSLSILFHRRHLPCHKLQDQFAPDNNQLHLACKPCVSLLYQLLSY